MSIEDLDNEGNRKNIILWQYYDKKVRKYITG